MRKNTQLDQPQIYTLPSYQTGILHYPEILELKLSMGTTSHVVKWRKINK